MQPVSDTGKNLTLLLPGAFVITVMVYWLSPSELRPLTTFFFAVICFGWLWREDIKARHHAEDWALRVAIQNRQLARLLEESLEEIAGGPEGPENGQADPELPDRIRKSLERLVENLEDEEDEESDDLEDDPPERFRDPPSTRD